ncbi:MAG: hypothetical protein EON58_03935 [Alphaproteobacteria bacterium]|nr:MAG: hypothetical protein EON58_03935 [Alphaproteobacteria bacterium]
MPRNHMRIPATSEPLPLNPTEVRAAIESGMRAYEVAHRLGVAECNLSTFMRRHEIPVLANGKVPPPDLSSPDRIIVWKEIPDSMSGVARLKRFALPRISMHVNAMQAASHDRSGERSAP